jgi:hypothetical protein
MYVKSFLFNDKSTSKRLIDRVLTSKSTSWKNTRSTRSIRTMARREKRLTIMIQERASPILQRVASCPIILFNKVG